MDDETFRSEVLALLSAIVGLMADAQPLDAGQSVSSKVERLLGLGLSGAQVARILNKEPNYITAVMSNRKRSGSSRKQRKERKTQ